MRFMRREECYQGLGGADLRAGTDCYSHKELRSCSPLLCAKPHKQRQVNAPGESFVVDPSSVHTAAADVSKRRVREVDLKQIRVDGLLDNRNSCRVKPATPEAQRVPLLNPDQKPNTPTIQDLA